MTEPLSQHAFCCPICLGMVRWTDHDPYEVSVGGVWETVDIALVTDPLRRTVVLRDSRRFADAVPTIRLVLLESSDHAQTFAYRVEGTRRTFLKSQYKVVSEHNAYLLGIDLQR